MFYAILSSSEDIEESMLFNNVVIKRAATVDTCYFRDSSTSKNLHDFMLL